MRDGGAMARVTLRAYFDAGCQNGAAALQLGIDRSTLARRLSRIERQLGYPPSYRQGELQTALLVEARLAATTFDARRTDGYLST
jgi:DNA-binding PucR family transcriptional regulator